MRLRHTLCLETAGDPLKCRWALGQHCPWAGGVICFWWALWRACPLSRSRGKCLTPTKKPIYQTPMILASWGLNAVLWFFSIGPAMCSSWRTCLWLEPPSAFVQPRAEGAPAAWTGRGLCFVSCKVQRLDPAAYSRAVGSPCCRRCGGRRFGSSHSVSLWFILNLPWLLLSSLEALRENNDMLAARFRGLICECQGIPKTSQFELKLGLRGAWQWYVGLER